jgi:hypothetical protein
MTLLLHFNSLIALIDLPEYLMSLILNKLKISSLNNPSIFKKKPKKLKSLKKLLQKHLKTSLNKLNFSIDKIKKYFFVLNNLKKILKILPIKLTIITKTHKSPTNKTINNNKWKSINESIDF